MTLTLMKSDLSKHDGHFVIWSSDKSFRRWFCHIFRGVKTRRIYFTIHFLGFVAAGSFPWDKNA